MNWQGAPDALGDLLFLLVCVRGPSGHEGRGAKRRQMPRRPRQSPEASKGMTETTLSWFPTEGGQADLVMEPLKKGCLALGQDSQVAAKKKQRRK